MGTKGRWELHRDNWEGCCGLGDPGARVGRRQFIRRKICKWDTMCGSVPSERGIRVLGLGTTLGNGMRRDLRGMQWTGGASFQMSEDYAGQWDLRLGPYQGPGGGCHF